MPLRDFPFRSLGTQLRPLLPINIINPHTSKEVRTYGIIDTGADTCTLNAEIAYLIGHNVKKGLKETAHVVGAKVDSWCHTTTIQMLDYNDNVFYDIKNAQIEYVENFGHVILGVNDFLINFKLEIDYPNKYFSIKNSKIKRLNISAP